MAIVSVFEKSGQEVTGKGSEESIAGWVGEECGEDRVALHLTNGVCKEF